MNLENPVTTTAIMSRRIRAAWARSDSDARKAGANWYSAGMNIVNELAEASGFTREQTAAAVAHLSPRLSWRLNIMGAQAMLLHDIIAPYLMRASVGRALQALGSTDPLSTLRGPKTSRFARNLLGDHDVVTVDAWMARVVLADRWKALGNAGVYDAVEACFQGTARRVGVAPAIMQAVIWISERNNRVN